MIQNREGTVRALGSGSPWSVRKQVGTTLKQRQTCFTHRKPGFGVSFLQKTPSSPVRCHATGFFSSRAEMFWWKDGEEIHDYVEHGEILPNADGTFQMSVDLKIKHSLEFDLMLSSGFPNVPEYVAMEILDGVIIAYYDSDIKTGQTRLEWVRKLMQNNSQHWAMHLQNCIHYQQVFKVETQSFQQSSNQTGGVHIFQGIGGCGLNNKTAKLTGILKYGYDGEDFLEFDLTQLKWIAQRKEALSLSQLWNEETQSLFYNADLVTNQCNQWLTGSLIAGQSTLLRTDNPSMSLLQKTPSSPVRCHATGFYPESFLMFWRKDGEEIHEGVDHGNVLTNQDITFQYYVDLDISSIPPQDWMRYDCVFQFTGAEDRIMVKLDKTLIKTNRDESSQTTIIIIAVVIVLSAIIIIIIAVGFAAYKKRNGE
ncbi:major histocompatibility complex class I-related gene protein-like [Girardinichthys multiradiatus]|uniref:major histocompatibility complex class I-related gene protein-like n=1 Tax=Girardinichthys multiradiatus TaxID=208333 RepID=UPI001FAD5F36|nr:major histocompatibility complex class I-related gene protein-like [Girardinichthys multiradiatus]